MRKRLKIVSRPKPYGQPIDYIFIKQMPLGECKYCDIMRLDQIEFHPSHTAKWYCESGKYNHCTCDTCF